jgi:superfamily II DNA or RNA helicase
MGNVVIGSEITVKDPPKILMDYCHDVLILNNPEYLKRLSLGIPVYGTSKKISLYSSFGNSVTLPFGCLRNIWTMIKDMPMELKFQPLRECDYHTDITIDPRPYQPRVIKNILKHKNGVVVSPCGSGKTLMGMLAIQALGGRALWLTHTSKLIIQSYDVAAKMFGEEGMGTITDGKIDIGERITFATVQTLKAHTSKYKDTWDIVIVDECHHCVSTPSNVTMFGACLSNISARYKIGLTATPDRKDGMDDAMYAILGGKIDTVTRDEVRGSTCPVFIRPVSYDFRMNPMMITREGTGVTDHNLELDLIINDIGRNRFIADIISHVKDGHKVMVLSERVEHTKTLHDICGGILIRPKGITQDGDLMFATYQYMSEGVDIPDLDTLVLATPITNPRMIEQTIGRLTRKHPSKEAATVFDICDTDLILTRQFNARKTVYRRLDYEVFN